MKYARMIRMYDGEGYSVAEVLSPQDTSVIMRRYVMVHRDSIVPDNLPEGVLLRTPLDRMVVSSTIYTDMLDELGASSSVRGVVDAAYIKTPSIADGLQKGSVKDCGNSTAPVGESIISTGSDGFLYCQYEGMELVGIDRLGVPLLTMVDNYETEPLGRAEWMLFIGELVGKRAEAEEIFKKTVSNYENIRSETTALKRRPKVMTDNLYQGIWYVPGGKSYQSNLISHAGGDYIFSSDNSTGTLNLSLEEMIAKASGADVWILRTFGPVESISEILKDEPRYNAFKPVKSGNVFVADGSTTDIFTLSAFHPDKVLQDYARIFNSVSVADSGKTEEKNNKPVFYKRVR